MGYFRLFNIKHLKKCTQSSDSFHKCSNNLRPTVALVDAKGKFFDQFKTSCILYFFTHVIRLRDMGAVCRVESKLKRLIYTFKKWNSISLMIVFVQNSNLLQ